MSDIVWVYLADEKVGLRVPREWANRDTLYLPDRPRFKVVSSVNPTPEPHRSREYRRTFPARWQLVVDEDVTIRAGEPLKGSATAVSYAEAVVFERVT